MKEKKLQDFHWEWCRLLFWKGAWRRPPTHWGCACGSAREGGRGWGGRAPVTRVAELPGRHHMLPGGMPEFRAVPNAGPLREGFPRPPAHFNPPRSGPSRAIHTSCPAACRTPMAVSVHSGPPRDGSPWPSGLVGSPRDGSPLAIRAGWLAA